MKKLLFFFVGLLCALPAISQVSIGSANTDVSLPVNPYYGFTFSQSIYLANEINTSGDIDSISYYLKPGSSLSNSNNWVVFIGHTTLSQFASTFIDVINSDTVFEGTISVTNDTIYIAFDAPFSYNGTDNIVITVLENFGGYDGFNDKFKGTSTTSPMSRRVQNDGSAFDPYTYSGYSSNINTFPDITFHGIVQSCPIPTNASVDSLTDISVGIGWTGNNPNFEVDIAQDATALGSGTVFVTSLDSLFTDTLTSVTDYRVYVREICGVGDTSGWLGPITFSTVCPSALTPDYLEEFDAYPTDCWSAFKGLISDSTTVESTTGYWYQDGFGNVGSSGAARLNLYSNVRDWLISPSIDLGDGSTAYQLSFDVALTSYYGTDPTAFGTDDSVFVVISTDNGTTWSDDNVLHKWHAGTALSNLGEFMAFDLSAYTGLVKFGFYGYSPIANNDINIYVDNFLIDPKPPCPLPLGLSVSSLIDSSAVLSWTSSDTSFAVEYGLFGFSQDPLEQNLISVSNDSLLLTGLNASTDYAFYVRTYCSGGDTSEWTGPYGFSTPCVTLSAPTALQTFDAIAPMCWKEAVGQLTDSTTLTIQDAAWNDGSYGNVSGSSSSAYINVYSNRKEWLISQSIDLGSGQNYQLEFDVVFTAYFGSGPASGADDDTLSVLISADNGVTWSAQNVLDTWDNSTGFPNDSERKVYDLSSYSGVVKFAFYAKSDVSIGSADFNAYIDNFKVNTCTQYISVSGDTACASYTSPYTGNVYSQTGIYSDTIANASCDSIYTLDITINPHTSASINVIECDTFVSVTGNAYTQTGVYYDTIPNMYSCDSVVQTNLSVLYVDLSVDQSQNVYLSSNESDPAASYQWVNCSDSSPISGETSIDFTASALGDYACQISIGSCVQISECISVTSLDSSTSIGQYTKSDIKVYPNPNNGQFTLELSEKPQDKLHLSISNTLGQVIYSKELNSSNNAISLDGVDKGIYIMSLTSPTQSLKTRIVID